MSFSDDDLMAYVDGELDAQTSGAVEAAAGRDPALAARVERQRKLRRAVHAAYLPVIEEPMPQRLLGLARGDAGDSPRTNARPRRWTWFEWGAMAASAVIGVVAGSVLLSELRPTSSVMDTAADFVADRGGMLARGALARALSEQLASAQATDAPVKVGLSFVSTGGVYCRTFTLERGAAARLGGLACRSGGDWRLQVIAEDERGAAAGEYGRAGSDVPPPVLRAVEERIQGGTLDAATERAAQQRGWAR